MHVPTVNVCQIKYKYNIMEFFKKNLFIRFKKLYTLLKI